MPRFVVQKHVARTLHDDFRLEKDSVFKNWAVSKGIPDKVGVRRLAVQADDHNLAMGEFAGAGTIEILDRGTYRCTEWTDDRISVGLKGLGKSVTSASYDSWFRKHTFQ